MNNKTYILICIFFGFFCGFLLGESLERGLSITIGRILYAGSILIVGLFWRSIDARSHQRHLEVWLELQKRGKWYFILTRYILLRGGLLLALFGVPLYFNANFTSVVYRTIALIFGVLVVMMILLGHLEWLYCEQDSNILAFRRAAEEAKQHAAMYN
jgi:hypothetical protein